MRKYVLSMLLVSISLLAIAQKEKPDLRPRQAVTLAAKQRLMAMKMTISKMFIISDIQKEKFTKDYATQSTWFQESVKTLKKYSTKKGLTKRVDIVGDRFEKYKESANLLDSTKTNIKEFITNSNLLFTVCNDQIKKLTQYAYDINTENSQRYRSEELLSRHISYVSKVRIGSIKIILYNLINYNKLDASASLNITKATEEIQSTLSVLLSAEINNNEVDAAIADAYVSWNTFKSTYYEPKSNRLKATVGSPIDIFDALTEFQTKLDEITFAYASLSGA